MELINIIKKIILMTKKPLKQSECEELKDDLWRVAKEFCGAPRHESEEIDKLIDHFTIESVKLQQQQLEDAKLYYKKIVIDNMNIEYYNFLMNLFDGDYNKKEDIKIFNENISLGNIKDYLKFCALYQDLDIIKNKIQRKYSDGYYTGEIEKGFEFYLQDEDNEEYYQIFKENKKNCRDNGTFFDLNEYDLNLSDY